jgi:hypothetical protein
VTLTISSAKRDEGGFVTVNGTVTNGNGEHLDRRPQMAW